MLSIRLPAELDKRLSEFAKEMGRSKSSLAKEAILTRLDDIERRYRRSRAHRERPKRRK